jgi:excisionase family DNA binding protein
MKGSEEHMERLYTTREAAEYLGLSIGTLQNWRWAGKGPAYLKSEEGTVRYTESALLSYFRRMR